jgi:hypothetical protein
MSYPTYQFQRGEPIVIGRQVIAGHPADYVLLAEMKPARGHMVPPANVPAIARFDVHFVPAAVDVPAHWLMTLAAAVSAGLAPGQYVTDVKFIRAGETVQISDPAFIVLSESVSG